METPPNGFKMPFWFQCTNCKELIKKIEDLEKKMNNIDKINTKLICCGIKKSINNMHTKPLFCTELDKVGDMYECKKCTSNLSFQCHWCGNFSNFMKVKCSYECKDPVCWEYQCSNCTRIFWKYSNCPQYKPYLIIKKEQIK